MQESEKFETAFSEFLDKNAYDTAQEALFQIVRQAFIAGWQAEASSRSQAEA